MSMLTWSGTEPLALGTTYLLEASAGTGKTWQIEALVVRLVAEYGIAIERILAITFTNAATAELRERVRRRLLEARDALANPGQKPQDPIFEHLWRDAGARSERHMNVARALSAFDLAPISTIHAFSQRMLEQLAFESGQQAGLELLADPKPMLHELIADELARVYDAADELELAVLEDMGWKRSELSKIALAMVKAVAPSVTPVPTSEELSASPIELARRWRVLVEEMRAWLGSQQGRVCLHVLAEEHARPPKATASKAKGKSKQGSAAPAQPARVERAHLGRCNTHYCPQLAAWLAGPALRSTREGDDGAYRGIKQLTFEVLGSEGIWKDDASVPADFEAAPLFQRVSALLQEQERLWPLARAGFARRIRTRVHAELERRSVLTYDTMLSNLAERIAEQGPAGQLATALRKRFDVALVDEFQDTDAAQWPVLKAVFAHPERRLLIIGDPKQAIYAFRGADVHVYLDAARIAQQRATMTCNRRSDGAYVRAMNHVFGADSGVFQLPGIDYVEVQAHHADARIRGLPARNDRQARALELRWFDAASLAEQANELDTTTSTALNKAQATELTPRLCAIEIARLLAAGVELYEEAMADRPAGFRPLNPGDIAVLVRTNRQGEQMRRQLAALNIPAVSTARGSVLQSPVVGWLRAFLAALAEPGRDKPARALAVTPLFGWTGEQLVRALEARDTEAGSSGPVADARWDAWVSTLSRWAKRYATLGFIRVLEHALDQYQVLPHLLAMTDGERYATDLRHLAELCHSEERRTRLGPAALAAWLTAAAQSTDEEEQALRLESDARAVQLVTVHKSKGLEYPIVMLPFAWDASQPHDKGQPLSWHVRSTDGSWQASLDLHPQGSAERQPALEAHAKESEQEDLRLLYVALTRARHHCVAWLGAVESGRAAGKSSRAKKAAHDEAPAPQNSGGSALLRVLCRPRDASGKLGEVGAGALAPFERLVQLAATSNDSVGVSTECLPEHVPALQLPPESRAELCVLPWTGRTSLLSQFQVTSYSSLVAGRTVEVDEPHRADETLAVDVSAQTDAAVGGEAAADDAAASHGLDEPSTQNASAAGLAADAPLAPMLGGTDVGTWVHEVLELLDFEHGCARDGRDAATLVAELGERHGIRATEQHALLTAALPGILETPLDGARTQLPEGFCLRQLERKNRIDELGFDLRLGAGSHYRMTAEPSAGLIDPAAARLALAARLEDEPSWPGATWLRQLLEQPNVLPSIAGILTGFIDLVLRSGSEARSACYYVADYKTNRIAAPPARRQSQLVHYTQPFLHWEMTRHGYPLQALLYSVALHRLLQQRLGEHYDYDQHVGGYLYLFLRGMQGGQPNRDGGLALGVLHDRWPRYVVLGLDAALHGATAAAVAKLMDAARRPGTAP